MSPQSPDLVAQRRRCDSELFRSPLGPLFPGAAAHPAGHHENAEAVGALEEAIVLVISLEPQGVEMHVEGVAHLSVLALRLRPEEHVRRPSAAANQDSAAVYAKEPRAFRSVLGGDLANSKAKTLP